MTEYKVMLLHTHEKTPVRGMTESQAHEILNRVRSGDKSPTQSQINAALILTGDIVATVTAKSIRDFFGLLADKAMLSRFTQVLNAMDCSESKKAAAIEANCNQGATVQRATWCSALVRSHE